MEAGKPAYVLPELPYAYDALQPVLSSQQLTLHHQKHHQAYVNGLNATLEAIEAALRAGDTKNVRALSDALAFNYGGFVLHNLYFTSLAPGGSAEPQGQLAELIKRDFGSVEALKGWLAAEAVAVTGSGWAVLAWEPVGGRLVVLGTERHDKLVGWGLVPLLPIDVWEHAYYVDYENRRPDYVKAVMGIINWDVVGERLAAALK
jgi:Fe-Mn family superoxide dismutase